MDIEIKNSLLKIHEYYFPVLNFITSKDFEDHSFICGPSIHLGVYSIQIIIDNIEGNVVEIGYNVMRDKIEFNDKEKKILFNLGFQDSEFDSIIFIVGNYPIGWFPEKYVKDALFNTIKSLEKFSPDSFKNIKEIHASFDWNSYSKTLRSLIDDKEDLTFKI